MDEAEDFQAIAAAMKIRGDLAIEMLLQFVHPLGFCRFDRHDHCTIHGDILPPVEGEGCIVYRARIALELPLGLQAVPDLDDV